MPHEHKWGRGYREVDVPVIDGVATMPDGRTIESTANSVRYPEPIDDFVCGVCGATRDTPAEHPQTMEGRLDFARWINGDLTRFCGKDMHDRCKGTISMAGIECPCLCRCHSEAI